MRFHGRDRAGPGGDTIQRLHGSHKRVRGMGGIHGGKAAGELGYSLAFSALAAVSLLAFPIIKSLRFSSGESQDVREEPWR